MPIWSQDKEMAPATSTAERQPPDKVTLYCPDCGHESRINGDWVLHVLAESLIYECPNCGGVIDSRRDEKALTETATGALQFAEN
jgi:predicted RNA-binding Zn-ribbon protein involved in translation (DUF1610 family)